MSRDELSDRRSEVLRAVIQAFVGTNRPVGSGTVAQTGIDVSSATIRKELSALEDEGYLHQPHTSAGRIPTEKGYRYFVDALMQPAPVNGVQFAQVREFFEHSHGELERMLKQTSDLLADLTRYAAVVVAPELDSVVIRSVQLVDIAHHTVLVVAVLSNGAVERRTIHLDGEIGADEVAAASADLAAAAIGETIASLNAADQPGAAAPAASLVSLAIRVLQSDDNAVGRLFVGGTSSVADVFDATETVADVLTLLERQLVVSSLIQDVLDRGMRVAIGTETGVETLNECSIVVAPYLVEGEEVGSIGVLGPQRMDYAQAIATVAIVSQGLSDHLSER